jgi:hypothetical protein
MNRIILGGRRNSGGVGAFWNQYIGETGAWNIGVDPSILLRMADPGKRFELWYPLRSKKWMVGAGGATTVNATPGTWTWSGNQSDIFTLLAATPGTWSWSGTTGAFTQLVSATPGTWSWVGTTGAFTQLINQTPGTWSWSGTTATFTQLVSAIPGTWSYSGTTATLNQLFNATPGTWTWAGVDAQIAGTVTIQAAVGTWGWVGTTAAVQATDQGKVGGDDVPRRIEVWTYKKPKRVETVVKSVIKQATQQAPTPAVVKAIAAEVRPAFDVAKFEVEKQKIVAMIVDLQRQIEDDEFLLML